MKRAPLYSNARSPVRKPAGLGLVRQAGFIPATEPLRSAPDAARQGLQQRVGLRVVPPGHTSHFESGVSRSGVSRSLPEAALVREPGHQVEPQGQNAVSALPSAGSQIGRGGAGQALGAISCALLGALLVLVLREQPPPAVPDVHAAVRKVLAEEVQPAPEARVFSRTVQSVVRVRALVQARADLPTRARAAAKGPPSGSRHEGDPPALGAEEPDGAPPDPAGPGWQGRGVGSGIVITRTGRILTSLHVIEGAERIEVMMADGTTSMARAVVRQPERDIAVLQMEDVPADLHPATMGSSRDVHEGDRVVAIGFPFNIGPSISSGVVSGLERRYGAREGQPGLKNLIQFDAAANPGSSGGPLIAMSGEVVGVVTAILNPDRQRSFVGIAFAVPIDEAGSAAGMPPH